MSYAQPRVARRSASHGALSSSYSAQMRASSDSGHHLMPFKPLRSIREHTQAFLDPSASVDGMLRKTTETGNIGIFSINATGNNTQLYTRPNAVRSRASLGDLRQPLRPRFFSNSSDRPHWHDDRRQLPSYRDSASEIISMYGSENQSNKSVSSPLTPPWDDSGQRSYSMTTCGSKRYLAPGNYGTQQVQDPHGRGQRPRSPYPYPTRLPRLGVRPSSPALTENGLVDYSRMVEIDRIPQRTTQHPHNMLFPYKTMRMAPPLSMRHGVNNSTTPYADDFGSCRSNPPPVLRRPVIPAHLQLWDMGPKMRLDLGSSDQSQRTMSLTSLSGGGYGIAPPRTPRLPPLPKKPIFYDYSEDFEDVNEEPPVYPVVSPIPQHVPKQYRPEMTENNIDVSPEGAEEGTANLVAHLRRMTTMGSMDDEGGSDEDNFRPVSQLSSRLSPRKAFSHSDSANSAELYVCPALFSGNGAQTAQRSRALTQPPPDPTGTDLETPSEVRDGTPEMSLNYITSGGATPQDRVEPETPVSGTHFPPVHTPGLAQQEEGRLMSLGHKSIDIHSESNSVSDGQAKQQLLSIEPVAERDSESDLPNIASSLPYKDHGGWKDSRVFSLSSGLSDLASFVQYIDKHIQAPDLEDVKQDENMAIPASRSVPTSRQAQCAQVSSAPPRKSSLNHYTRDQDQARFNVAGPGDELQQYQVISTRSGPTLVPQPISPARMLRVKNSIPHLMKALPPLPGYSPAPESPFGPAVVPMEFEPFEVSQLTDARSTLIETIMPHQRVEDVSKGYDPFVFDRERKPRLKLKHAASFSPGYTHELRREYIEQSNAALPELPLARPSTAAGNSTTQAKRRLPIKMSRPVLAPPISEDTGTVKRRLGLSKCSTVSDLATNQAGDLFSLPVNNQAPVGNMNNFRGEQRMHQQRQVFDNEAIPGNDARRTSMDAPLDTLRLPSVESQAAGDGELQSFFSDSSLLVPHRGVRKQISALRLKLTDSHHHQRASTRRHSDGGTNGAGTLMPGNGAQSTNTFKNLLKGKGRSKTDPNVSAPCRNVKARLGRLVKGAKDRLRSWGRGLSKAD